MRVDDTPSASTWKTGLTASSNSPCEAHSRPRPIQDKAQQPTRCVMFTWEHRGILLDLLVPGPRRVHTIPTAAIPAEGTHTDEFSSSTPPHSLISDSSPILPSIQVPLEGPARISLAPCITASTSSKPSKTHDRHGLSPRSAQAGVTGHCHRPGEDSVPRPSRNQLLRYEEISDASVLMGDLVL
jgi:hypothetical protein